MSADTHDDCALRARVFLRAVLPLVSLVAERSRGLSATTRGAIELSLADESLASTLSVDGARAHVTHGRSERPDVRWVFRDARSLNDFFIGRPSLPKITPWMGLASPLVSARGTQLLLGLRVLDPRNNPPSLSLEDKRLRVRMLLALVTRAIAELHRCEWAPARSLTKVDRERVFQWTISETGDGAYLRVRPDRACAGTGVYSGREPFVHTVFRDVESAFSALTASKSQMEGFRGGAVVTHGSPEYVRKVSYLMQQVDAMLMGS
ncbi:MAG: hypothetical protein JNK05_33580 [Myxococcales bacterium]|nr:hypothetical protein [Myxococcales bacterium]